MNVENVPHVKVVGSKYIWIETQNSLHIDLASCTETPIPSLDNSHDT